MPQAGNELSAANTLIRSGRIREAKAQLERLLSSAPGNRDAGWLLAEVEVALGEIDRAVARATILAKEDAAAAEVLYRFGVSLHRRGRPDAAVLWYRSAVAAAPRSLEPWCNLGAALQALGQNQDAAKAYEAALRLKSDFPEVLGNLGNARLALGEPAAALQVLNRAVALNPSLATAWNSLGIALKTLDQLDEARAAYETATKLNPDYADAHANLGTLHKLAGRPDDAEAAYRKALQLAPGRDDTLNNLGGLLNELGRHQEAEVVLRDALKRNPRSVDALCNLGNALLGSDDVDGAEQCLLKALEFTPTHVEALCNLGNAHLARNRLDEALACYERAERAAPAYPEALFNESLVYLARGDFARGWPLYEHRFAARKGRPPRTFPGVERLQRGTALQGRTVLVHAEQGLGDTLQFARLLPALRAAGARVRLEVQPPLVALLAESGLADSVHATGGAPGDYDLYCPLLSLANAVAFDPLAQPAPRCYLKVPAAAKTPTYTRFADADKPRVGIVWSGNPKHRNDRRRSLGLEQLLAAFHGFKGTFVSLQKERSPADRDLLGQWVGLIDAGPAFTDFGETAATVAELDLVITVDTSVAHLAGALGVPTWVLLPFAPDWRWMLGREDSPWYPSLRLLRQPRIGDWDTVLGRVRDDLAGLALGATQVS